MAHEGNEPLSIQTEIGRLGRQYAAVQARRSRTEGEVQRYRHSNGQRDARLVEALIELAETRSIARALSFGRHRAPNSPGAEESLTWPSPNLKESKLQTKQADRASSRRAMGTAKGKRKRSTAPQQKDRRRKVAAMVRRHKHSAERCMRRTHQYTQADTVQAASSSMGAATFEDLTREQPRNLSARSRPRSPHNLLLQPRP